MMRIVFEASVQHTGTSFLQMLLAYVWTAHGFIQVGIYNPPGQIVMIKNRCSTWVSSYGELASLIRYEFRKDRYKFVSEPNFIGIVHAHFGEGESSFISQPLIEYLAGKFSSVMPVRDPLLSLISRHIRVNDKGESYYLVNGFVLMADFWERRIFYYFPVDLYDDMKEEQRFIEVAKLLASLGLKRPCFEQLRTYIEKPPKVGSWMDFDRAQPGHINRDYANYLKDCYSQGDIREITKEIPFGVDYLKRHESKLRPFLESLGYKNLIWWR